MANTIDHTQHRVAFLIRSFNRPNYLRETLTSVLQSDIHICTGRFIYDDGSSDPAVHELLDDPQYTQVPGKEFVVVKGEKQLGCKNAYIAALRAISADYDYICTVDNDVHVKKTVIQTFLDTYDTAFSTFRTRNMLLTGFTPSNAHKNIIKKYPTFHVKRSCGGVSYFFHTHFKSYILDKWQSALDWGVCNDMARNGYPLVCVNNGIVQHIGKHGLYSHGENAYDNDQAF